MKAAIGIDPGLSGAIVFLDLSEGKPIGAFFLIPVSVEGKTRAIDYGGVCEQLTRTRHEFGIAHIYLERAVPMAMGSASAFNYGRGFQILITAIESARMAYTLVEPQKWTKEMHEGIRTDLKPKARSLIAVKRLYPSLIEKMPKNKKGELLDGPVDALLIAGYGLRKMGISSNVRKAKVVPDFY